MSQYTSYYLYQKYQKIGSQDAVPVYPSVFSVDGDGTMPLVVKSQNDTECGYVPSGTTIYRWVNMDSSNYICDDCIEPQYRTISTAYTCVGYDKHYLDEYQVSYDSGTTWNTLSSTTGSLIEANSEYCGYVPPTLQSKWFATYSGERTASAECDSTSAITSGEITSSSYNLVEVEIGDCVTTIGTSAFTNCKSLSSVTMPNSVTSIGDTAFKNCLKLSSVTIPNSVTTIGNYAFEGCYRITSIDIPNSVTTIGMHTFYACYGFTSATIGSGVTVIGHAAFYKCSGLTSITINATTPPALGQDVLYNTNNCPIYVPASSVDAYKSASGWSDYASRIQAIQ